MKKCCWLYANEKLKIYSACFMGKSITELVEDFNQEVGKTNQDQDRAYYHEALLQAIQEKGIDVSAISDGREISFMHAVQFDEERRALVLKENE